MKDNNIELIEQEFNEFDFENYSLLHNILEGDWSIEYYDETYGDTIMPIDDYIFDDEENKELLNSLEFTKEDFEKIKEFESKNGEKIQ